MTRFCSALFLAAALTATSAAQKRPDVPEGIGPKIGDVAPDFEAPDQHGRLRRLSALLGPKGTMLVFYRSADW